MATISSQIQLYDRMSAPLQNITTAMNQMISSCERMQSTMSQSMDTSSIDAARGAIAQAEAQMNQLGEEIEEANNNQKNLNQSFEGGNASASKLMQTIAGLAGTFLSMQGVKKIVDMSDNLVTTQARVGQMNDGLQSTDDLMNQIYQAAQRSRGSFDGMADVVARFGNNAKDAFKSSQEVVAFSEIVQKQMTIAGAGPQEASNAMLQLSQALGSGVLRGDELNSIFEQAPNLIRSIADYLDVPIGKIREMASEGKLSADVVKAAVFASADSVEEKFNAMPMTWGQVWQRMQNKALIMLKPLLNKINELANDPKTQKFINNLMAGFETIISVASQLFDIIIEIGNFMGDNWDVIAPIIMAVVGAIVAYNVVTTIATGLTTFLSAAHGALTIAMGGEATAAEGAAIAQMGLNTTMLACPAMWLVMLLVALVAALFIVSDNFAKTSDSANSAFGVIVGGVFIVGAFFKNLGLTIAAWAQAVWAWISDLGSNIANIFWICINAIQGWWFDLLSTVLSVIADIAAALNQLPFISFDYSGLTSAANDFANQKAAAYDDMLGHMGNLKDAGTMANDYLSTLNNKMGEYGTWKDGWADEAFDQGAVIGDQGFQSLTDTMDSVMKDFGLDGANNLGSDAASTAGNTGRTADALEITNENLKYIREAAEASAINRYTIAEIKVDMTNNNNISSTMDIDGVVQILSDGVQEAMEQAAEGVY